MGPLFFRRVEAVDIFGLTSAEVDLAVDDRRLDRGDRWLWMLALYPSDVGLQGL